VPKPPKRSTRAAGKVARTLGEPDAGTSPPKSDYDDGAEIWEELPDGRIKSWTLIHEEAEARQQLLEAEMTELRAGNSELRAHVEDLIAENVRLSRAKRDGVRSISERTLILEKFVHTMLTQGYSDEKVHPVLREQFPGDNKDKAARNMIRKVRLAIEGGMNRK
jgi:hypothetical protein